MSATASGIASTPGPPATGKVTARALFFIPFYLIFLTSSFDVFLNFRVAGFSLRFCYLIILLLVAAKLTRLREYLFDRNEVVGFVPLAGWTLFLGAFVFNTSFLARSVGYYVWHIIHILFIVILVGSFNRLDSFLRLHRFYVRSFAVLAAFGLLQFAAGLAGLDLFVTQWWFPRVPRINGFSYEPSYFGSYLIIGWVMLFCLLAGRAKVLPFRETLGHFLLVSACLILSSSRMAIAAAVSASAAFVLWIGMKAFLTLRVRRMHLGIMASVLCLLILGSGAVYKNLEKMQFLFAGLSLGAKFSNQGGSSHSVGARAETTAETFAVFTSSPFVGVSLGGVATALAERRGFEVASNDVARRHEGMNIFVEVLAASGLFGFPFFLAYLYTLFRGPIRLIRWSGAGPPYMGVILLSLTLGLLLELIMLALNQNILRPFLWVHIGMLSLAYKVGRICGPSGARRPAPMPFAESGRDLHPAPHLNTI